MSKTYIGLGSNLGNRIANIKLAIEMLPGDKRVSRLYETEPLDSPEGSGKFINAVVELELEPNKDDLLGLIQRIESAGARVREQPNGPRTIDVDVVYVEGFTSDDQELTIPHPRAYSRAFVIAPLLDLNAEVASLLNPDMCRAVADANNGGRLEVFPGVILYGDSPV